MGNPVANDEPSQFAAVQRQNIESKDAPAYFLKERMTHLVEAVLEGRVVPFLEHRTVRSKTITRLS